MSDSPQLRDALPEPALERWQPLRIGLVELFHYDTEEFWFRDGHLLLRGNNGTGKSKVLALTLPFLLDGDASPHRVEPDGDPKKRMDWNLLLGGRHDERVGYAWIEFARRDPDAGGAPRYLTLGCGMKAAAGKGVVDKWFLLSPERMGRGLHLVDRAGIVLAKDRLREVLGDQGVLLAKAEEYRRFVNERLFGLDQRRYDALLSLLVQLRQPQLSKRPDLAALNRALTEALPPLPTAVIADVADAMRNLERERQDLADLEQARAAVGRFGEAYRTYAAIATVRRADEVASRTVDYEDTGRQLGAQQRERDAAADRHLRLTEQEAGLRREANGLRAREQTLRESPEMRDARRLDDARQRADDLTRRADDAAGLRDAAAGDLNERRRRHTGAEAARSEADDRVEAARAGVADAAARAGLGPDHLDGRALAAATTPSTAADDDGERTDPVAMAERIVGRRREAVAHVRRLTAAAHGAEEAHTRARAAEDEAVSVRDRAAEAETVAREALDAVGHRWLAAAEEAAAGWTVLPTDGLEEALSGAAEWASQPEGNNPFDAFATSALRAVEADVARLRVAREAERDAVDADRAALQQELDGLLAGTQPVPDPSPTRPADRRAGRPGAPLWQLIDFRDGLSAAERAGLEAALEGGGLLDAWVTPDGGLLQPETLDAAVTTASPPAESPASQALKPAGVGPHGTAPPVADGVVADVLARVGLGPATADTWIDVDGRFRVGVVEGAWTKGEATVIGWAAREAARVRRIEAVRAAIAEEQDRLDRLAEGLAGLDERAERARVEATAPDDGDLRGAAGDAVVAARLLADAQAGADRAAAAARTAAETARTAAADRDAAAVEVGVPTQPAEQEAIQEALNDLRAGLAGLWPRIDALVDARAAERRAAADVDRAAGALAARQRAADTAAEDRDRAAAELATLNEMVGESVQRVVEVLAETQRQRAQAEADADLAREEATGAAERRARADGRVEGLRDQLEERRQRRDEAVDALRRLVGTGLVEAATAGTPAAEEVTAPDPGRQWAAEPGVRLARELRRALSDADAGDRAWDRAGSAIMTSLADLQRTLAAQGARAWSEPREDAIVVGVHFGGTDHPVHRLAGVLDGRMEDRRTLLDARERQILEEHLITEIAAQLARLIGDAEVQVARMNAELSSRPTSTGMVLRLRWRPETGEGPAGLGEALKRLLRQSSGAWSEDDRHALGVFLQAEIARRRAEDPAGTWMEHLTRAFDYRRWHRFVVERRAGDGTWRNADGPASGGERALAVTVPLFAAASAHYSSAGPAAPRLVLLDEAFAGVDDAARRQCLGLLDTFDLDYVLTSEREWGCYPEVPGLSICHLVRRDGVDAVHVSRWEWDGSAQARRDRPADSARQPVPAADGGLFAT